LFGFVYTHLYKIFEYNYNESRIFFESCQICSWHAWSNAIFIRRMDLFVNNMADTENVKSYMSYGNFHIFRNLFVCFPTSVYTLRKFHENRNNSTDFTFSVSAILFTNKSIRRMNISLLQACQLQIWQLSMKIRDSL
jgi:hypothetical protein